MSTSDPHRASHSWAEILIDIEKREELTPDKATWAMESILSGEASAIVMAGFLTAMRTKGETAAEMTSFAKVMANFGRVVDVAQPVIDTCGTGGDRSHTINVSTTAALIVAGAGGLVCKHGGRASSSMSGSADVLEALDVVIDLDEDGVKYCLDTARIGFGFAPIFHPAMANVVPVRRELKVPTLFNFLGPLVNPARASRQIVGVSDPQMADVLIGVLSETGSTHAMVVFGDDGLDELTTTAPSNVVELVRDEYGYTEIRRYRLDAAHLGFARATATELRGGSAEDNARALLDALEGVPGPKADIAILNAAGGIYVGGLASSMAEAVDKARESVQSGAARTALELLVKSSHEARAPEQ
jgi:anthranilate phosphoribosyltransferase